MLRIRRRLNDNVTTNLIQSWIYSVLHLRSPCHCILHKKSLVIACKMCQRSGHNVLQYSEVRSSKTSNRIPTLSSLAKNVMSVRLKILTRTYIETRSSTSGIVTDGDIVESLRESSADSIKQWVEETQGFKASRDTDVVQKRHDTGEGWGGRRGSTN